MKHKIKVKLPVEKRGFLGIKKTVMETRTIEVDGETYKKLKKEWNRRPYSIEEMMLYAAAGVLPRSCTGCLLTVKRWSCN